MSGLTNAAGWYFEFLAPDFADRRDVAMSDNPTGWQVTPLKATSEEEARAEAEPLLQAAFTRYYRHVDGQTYPQSPRLMHVLALDPPNE